MMVVTAVTSGDVDLGALVIPDATAGTMEVPGPPVLFKAFVTTGSLVAVNRGVFLDTLENHDEVDVPKAGVALRALVMPGGTVVAFAGHPFSLSSSGLTTMSEVTGVTKLYLRDRLVAFSVNRRRVAVSLARNRACSRSWMVK